MPEPNASIRSSLAPRKLGLGELGVLAGTGTVRTLLGSCIGLVLHDQKHHVGGMAHIVLPESNGTDHPPGKYADTAVPELIRQIEAAGGQARQLSAKLAGGANMFASTNLNSIGEQNLAMVERLLRDVAIPVLARHCGGQQGRKMAYDVETGAITVEIVGGTPVEI
jgi:chemotaxis protein CheD